MAGEVLGFNTWTKNMPQPYLEDYAEAAERKQVPIVALVDDVLSSVIFSRSEEQSHEYNEAYRTTMLKMGFTRVDFVSSVLPERSQDLDQFYKISQRVTLPSFMALLPEKKLLEFDSLKLTETIDTCWQLNVLEAGMSCCGITRYLTGKRSTAFFRYAKKIIDNFEFDIIDE